ncbi:MAG: metallophosphoesterase [Phycisphaerae bacterium]
MAHEISRRDWLRGTAAAAAAGVLGSAAPNGHVASAAPAAPAAAQGFRFVHLTDIHVQPERAADRGLARALRAVEALRPRPDFILTGGDLVFDVFAAPAPRAESLFKMLRKVFADNTSLPVHHACGNHDVFGWGAKHGVTPATPGYGKALVKQSLELHDLHYAFDHKGWRFLVLDNVQPGPGPHAYVGALDGEQKDWLAQELTRSAGKQPIVTVEHIPLLSASPFAFTEYRRPEGWELPNALVCMDAADRLKLYRDRNVRLCLSGHLHQLDRVEMHGTTFICDGAVCGNWWRGAYEGLSEGFGVLDLRPDGTFDHSYVTYGWQAQA